MNTIDTSRLHKNNDDDDDGEGGGEDTLLEIRTNSERLYTDLTIALSRYSDRVKSVRGKLKYRTTQDRQTHRDLVIVHLLASISFSLADMALSQREGLDNA